MRPIIGTLALVLAVTTVAGDALAAPSAEAVALARRYFAASQMDEKVRLFLNGVSPSLVAQMIRKNPQLTEPQRAKLKEAALEAEQDTARKMVERLAPAFAETFTEAELTQIVAFYEGPAGRALIGKTPVFAAQMDAAFRTLAPEMLADINGRFCAKVACKAEPSAPTSPARP
jgi:hypothetical protein